MNSSIESTLKSLPKSPGVYIFKNDNKEVIYVGKAKSLKSRVGSYFLSGIDPRSKTFQLVQNISHIEFIEVLSEIEALILEATLIKKHKPKYNINLKDDKSYLYIVIRNEDFGNKVKLKKVILARKTDINSRTDDWYGPFLDSSSAKNIYRLLRKIVPFRDCSFSKFNRYKKIEQPCLYGHLGLCSAPCINRISSSDYSKDIYKVKKILNGKTKQIAKDLEKKMLSASKNLEFEKAAKYKDLLFKFKYVLNSKKDVEIYLQNPYLVEDLQKKSLLELKESIPIIKEIPSKIECYDISNLFGKDATAALVTSIDGKLEKSMYKRFKIKSKDTPDDFSMLAETLERRIKRGKNAALHDSWALPDLIVLDGGKGQVSTIIKVLEDHHLDIPVIGLAKRFETIIFKKDHEFYELKLSKDNQGLKFLQQMRDEAHRFSRKYHHLLRIKSFKI